MQGAKYQLNIMNTLKKHFQHMEDIQIITPVTAPREWALSITYPCKPDGPLHICLDPRDLNKATIREHCKAPTLKDIPHKLVGATIFPN